MNDPRAETREHPVMRRGCAGCAAADQHVTDLRFALTGLVNALEGGVDLEGSGEDGVLLAEAKRVLGSSS